MAGFNSLLYMPGLTSLSILGESGIIFANATKIMSKQLQTLDLSGIEDINETFFLQIIEQSGKTLKSLNLSNSKISGDNLVEYNGALSCLEKLELKGCRRLTDTGLQQILKLCGKTLISLNLSWCHQITDEGLLQIFKVCGKTLRYLNLAYTNVTEESLVEFNGTLVCLENLYMKDCDRLTNRGLLQILRLCDKTLRSLNLANTDITGESLVGYSGTLACLENLNLRGCPISDEGLLQIFKVCGKTLRYLNLTGTNITGESLVGYSGTLACLENLNLSCCPISDMGLLQIFRVCGKTLKSLKLDRTWITRENLLKYKRMGLLPDRVKVSLNR